MSERVVFIPDTERNCTEFLKASFVDDRHFQNVDMRLSYDEVIKDVASQSNILTVPWLGLAQQVKDAVTKARTEQGFDENTVFVLPSLLADTIGNFVGEACGAVVIDPADLIDDALEESGISYVDERNIMILSGSSLAHNCVLHNRLFAHDIISTAGRYADIANSLIDEMRIDENVRQSKKDNRFLAYEIISQIEMAILDYDIKAVITDRERLRDFLATNAPARFSNSEAYSLKYLIIGELKAHFIDEVLKGVSSEEADETADGVVSQNQDGAGEQIPGEDEQAGWQNFNDAEAQALLQQGEPSQDGAVISQEEPAGLGQDGTVLQNGPEGQGSSTLLSGGETGRLETVTEENAELGDGEDGLLTPQAVDQILEESGLGSSEFDADAELAELETLIPELSDKVGQPLDGALSEQEIEELLKSNEKSQDVVTPVSAIDQLRAMQRTTQNTDLNAADGKTEEEVPAQKEAVPVQEEIAGQGELPALPDGKHTAPGFGGLRYQGTDKRNSGLPRKNMVGTFFGNKK